MSELPRNIPRKHRVEHPPERHHQEEGHSWAVSYADFLMVLLSFFIIFFSIDQNKRPELIDQITNQLSEKGGSPEARKPAGEHPEVPASISEKLKDVAGLAIVNDGTKRELSITFEDNIYKPGKVELSKDHKQKLANVLTQLRPYQSEIKVTFIGHTDNKKVRKGKGFIKDNFVLSSLRATTALQLAASSGFNPTSLYAQGAAENSRGSRTLSLLITGREKVQ